MNHDEYLQYLETPEWKARAEAAKKRARYKCQICGSTKQLDAHHKTYDRLGHENDSDITVLCRNCHRRKHGKVEPKYSTTIHKKKHHGNRKKHYKPYYGKLGTSRMGDGIYTPRTSFGRAR